MNRFCIDRHASRIDAVFADYAVRPVGLKQLWALNWHREFNRQGPWTKAGDVQPTDWPQWMWTFQDY